MALRHDGASLVVLRWVLVVVGKLSFVFRRFLGISLISLVPLVPWWGWSWRLSFPIVLEVFKGVPSLPQTSYQPLGMSSGNDNNRRLGVCPCGCPNREIGFVACVRVVRSCARV